MVLDALAAVTRGGGRLFTGIEIFSNFFAAWRVTNVTRSRKRLMTPSSTVHAVFPEGVCIHSCSLAKLWQSAASAARDEWMDGVTAILKQELVALLPRLRRFARSLAGSVADADDLVQEACLRAIAKQAHWDPAQPLDRWMFTITRNLWISEIRKRQVRFGQGQVDAAETAELQSVTTGEGEAEASQLRHKIDALPGELSSVLLLVSVEGYSYAEAAELLDVPVGTIMSRMHRARKTLAVAIGDASQEDRR